MIGDRSLHPTWWDFVLVLTGPMRNHVEYRESVLAGLLSERRLPFTHLETIPLPEGRAAALYRPAPPPVAVNATGEDLITAVNRRGEALYPIGRATWLLPGGARTVAVSSEGMPVEFPYVYLTTFARTLVWEAVRDREARCGDASYSVKVFDLNSRRGPNRELARAFTLPAVRQSQPETLDIAELRGQVVTVQVSPLSPADATHSCIGWSDIRVVGDHIGADAAEPDAFRLATGR
jgi:hypothetical protein